ncbi:MAG: GatB/YqeY domain-containing protein [Chloroflexi bacterium]|nr:GatB/YqeY domain-containing protein [Chloroflexota bacterium]MDA1146945.1 GatB/YqeY domain-containing protein [Chloroflexota bacterium]MQC83000.1 GatB/YqeY domain-containing protein [Chloroflexota bacterium]
MSSIATTIRQEMVAATKAGERFQRDTLRLLIAAIENGRIEAGHELSDDETLKVLQKEAKQRRDSIEEYRKGAREDLVASEEAELAIIATFLPEQLDDAAVRLLVEATIAEVGASGMDDLGKVMGPLMQKLDGRADGRAANAIVRELLSG